MLTLLLLSCRGPDPAPSPPVSDASTEASADTGEGSTGPTGATGHTGTLPGTVTDTALPLYQGPARLSETELYADIGTETLADGVVPYDLRYPLWSDGSEKRRWLFVPVGETIDTTDPDEWVFPVGTVAFKEFVRDGVRVETRRFAKLADGWDYGTYLWRADGSDADFVNGPLADVLGTEHDVPERADCIRCHEGIVDRFLGVEAVQLPVEQQALLPLTATVEASVPGKGTVQEALGLLHSNCGNCHQAGALAAEETDLLLDLRVADVDPGAVHAVTTGVGTATKHHVGGTSINIVAGDPEASQLWVRMGMRGLLGMPPVGGEVPDEAGQQVVGDWIRSLP